MSLNNAKSTLFILMALWAFVLSGCSAFKAQEGTSQQADQTNEGQDVPSDDVNDSEGLDSVDQSLPAPAPAPAPAPFPPSFPPAFPPSTGNGSTTFPDSSPSVGEVYPVYSNFFFSLHQSPITYVKSSGLDSQGNLVFNETAPLVGFKDQFMPAGTPGCAMGYPEYRSECQTVNGGFGFILKGVTSYSEYKFYVPAGMTFFGVSGYLPQSEKYAVAVRIDQAPQRRTPLSESEYQAAKLAQHKEFDFAKILAGEERLIVHDGGGNISISGIGRMATNPLPAGRWMYVRVLNGGSIHGLGGIYEVQRDIYKSEYYKMLFSRDGDPF